MGLSVFYTTWGGILETTETKEHKPGFTHSHVPEQKAEDGVAHAVLLGHKSVSLSHPGLCVL